ncbi:hypothetical protein [Isoptericola sp. NPDC057559]|uniref:hypothetical protein n=1 Tax=Isoptericola sp. NPDC057559 TaxID=3346168 RepID=UPI00367ED83A
MRGWFGRSRREEASTPAPEPVVVLFCYGGNNNFGDDYLLDLWIRWYRSKGITVVVPTVDDWMSALYFGDGGVHLSGWMAQVAQQERRKRKSVTDLGEALLESGGAAAGRILATEGPWKDVVPRIRGIHLAGGGYLNSYFERGWLMAATLTDLGRRLSVPVFGTGLGLTPMPESVALSSEVLSRLDRLEVRDEESFAAVRRLLGSSSNLVQGIDDAFLAPVRTASDAPREGTLTICVQSDMEGAALHDSLVDRIQSTVALNPGRPVRYLEFFGPDRKFRQRLAERVMIDELVTKPVLFAGGLPVTAQDVVVTTRFHLHLLASRAGARGVFASARAGYYDTKHASVVRCGSRWSSLDETGSGAIDLGSLSTPRIDERSLVRQKRELAGMLLKEVV